MFLFSTKMSEINELIQMELDKVDLNELHHSIKPLDVSKNQNFKDLNENFSFSAIDLSRYSNLDDESLKVSLIYSILKDSSLLISNEFNEDLFSQLNNEITNLIDEAEMQLDLKNIRINKIGNKRMKLVEESKSTLDYLNDRRLESLKKIVEIKIESIKLELQKKK